MDNTGISVNLTYVVLAFLWTWHMWYWHFCELDIYGTGISVNLTYMVLVFLWTWHMWYWYFCELDICGTGISVNNTPRYRWINKLYSHFCELDIHCIWYWHFCEHTKHTHMFSISKRARSANQFFLALQARITTQGVSMVRIAEYYLDKWSLGHFGSLYNVHFSIYKRRRYFINPIIGPFGAWFTITGNYD